MKKTLYILSCVSLVNAHVYASEKENNKQIPVTRLTEAIAALNSATAASTSSSTAAALASATAGSTSSSSAATLTSATANQHTAPATSTATASTMPTTPLLPTLRINTGSDSPQHSPRNTNATGLPPRVMGSTENSSNDSRPRLASAGQLIAPMMNLFMASSSMGGTTASASAANADSSGDETGGRSIVLVFRMGRIVTSNGQSIPAMIDNNGRMYIFGSSMDGLSAAANTDESEISQITPYDSDYPTPRGYKSRPCAGHKHFDKIDATGQTASQTAAGASESAAQSTTGSTSETNSKKTAKKKPDCVIS